MSSYKAPLENLSFVINDVTDFKNVTNLENFKHVTNDLVQAVFEEAGKLASGPIGDVNTSGDREGSYIDNGVVRTPAGFKEAYSQYVDGGWNGISFPEEIGGQGLPFTIALGVNEIFTSANMAFSLCPLLTTGAIEAMAKHASSYLNSIYLPKMLSGEWTGTMNLTEPQAGSDVGALTTKAIQQEDGSYLITGTKIYITYGDHDLSENIVHLVLARTPDAPEGTRGISLFLVPKYLVKPDGSLGNQNDLRCVSLEHKLGINASPTAVMSFGENIGAKGWLIGEVNKGMKCMFTMMNHARIGVGVEGLAVADRSYQQALRFAIDRKQGYRPENKKDGPVSIVKHPDVKRMLMVMGSHIEAMRSLVLNTGVYYDLGKHHNNENDKLLFQGVTDLLTPIVKSWCTDIGFECTSIGIQLHGGMGFVEETGIAQHMRDIRITPIYEGTNGIQALDLVSRKLLLNDKKPVNYIFSLMKSLCEELENKKDDSNFLSMLNHFSLSIIALENSTNWICERIKDDFDSVESSASNYLKMFGYTLGAYYLIKGSLAASDYIKNQIGSEIFYLNKISHARFFVEQYLPASRALNDSIIEGKDALSLFDFDFLESSL